MEMIYHYAQNYRSENKKRPFATPIFYAKLFKIVYDASHVALKGEYSNERWVYDSFLVGQAMESVGADIVIEGHENIKKLDRPCVFVANHMSTLETFFLPSIIQPVCNHTFVVKESLLNYPLLGPVLSAEKPITVTRTKARQDLRTVLEKGQEKLANGESIIIFAQGTRKPDVKAEDFSSLGVKLAKKANAPVIPIALKTNAWGTSPVTKDFGTINPDIPIRISFGEPFEIISNNGKEEHQKCLDFIINTYNSF